MSDRTPDAGPGRTDDDGSSAAPGARPREGGPPARRPTWVWVVVGLAVVVLVAVAVLVLSNRGGDEPVVAQPPEVVTLPVPSPTIEPIEREEGSAFYAALPSTVLDYALTETAEDPELVADGALEGYRLVYSDGGTREVVVRAGQWASAAEVDEVFDALTAAARAEAETASGDGDAEGATEDATEGEGEEAAEGEGEEAADEDAATPSPGELEEGVVEAGGEQVGRYLLLPGADGETVWWTNGTVLLQADGASVRDVYAAFPL